MKEYTKPEIDIVKFETEDVITGSGCNIFAGEGDSSCNETPIL